MSTLKLMRNLFVVLLLASSLSELSAQEKKYQSLLWEISHPDLEKKSYLYGTMHVSERVAFRLSDAFFEALLETDAVALESSPDLWLDSYSEFMLSGRSASSGYGGDGYRFYSKFADNPIENQSLIQPFRRRAYTVNQIMFRTNNNNSDFQEDTYLDMFIYQSAKRTGRKVLSLEDIKESALMVLKAGDNYSYDFQPKKWALKMLKGKSRFEILEEAYRNKDLDLIDSLNIGFSTPEYLKWMLYERNRVMVESMDSIMKNESLFSAVGAAHLPGEQGVIEMLKEKGYTVRPLIDNYTEQGLAKKKNLEASWYNSTYKLRKVSDGSFRILSPDNFYSNFNLPKQTFMALDLPNGISLEVFRVPTKDYLRNDDYSTGKSRVDSLFFENIPGEIISKKEFKLNGYDAFDIKNRKDNGDRQRYWVAVTPMEVYYFVLSGKKSNLEFIEEKIAESIWLKPLESGWERVSPLQGLYSVEVPKNYRFAFNDSLTTKFTRPQLDAFDLNDKAFYKLKHHTLMNTKHLEESTFELERICFEYAKNLEKDTLNSEFNEAKKYFYTQIKLSPKKQLHLAARLKGQHYILQTATGSTKNAKKFFNSFRWSKVASLETPTEYSDSLMHFTLKNAPQDPLQIDYNKPYSYSEQKENPYESVIRNISFYNSANERVKIRYTKFNDFQFYENLDSLWLNETSSKWRAKDFILLHKKKYKQDGWNRYDIIETDTANWKKIKRTYYQKGGRMYALEGVIPEKGDSSFYESILKSFTPKDTLIGRSPFKDKSAELLELLRSEDDSIRDIAWMNFQYADFKDNKNDLLKLIDKELAKEKPEKLVRLVEKYLNLDNLDLSELKGLYEKMTNKFGIQFRILQNLLTKETEKSFAQFNELINQDLPLQKQGGAKQELFSTLLENPDLTSGLYPELLDLYFIPEYKEDLAILTADLWMQGYLKPRHLKPIKRYIVQDAKLELKRNQKVTSHNDYSDYGDFETYNHGAEAAVEEVSHSYSGSSYSNIMLAYLVLLDALKKEEELSGLERKAFDSDSWSMKKSFVEFWLNQEKKVPQNRFNSIWKETDDQYKLFKLYIDNERVKEFPVKLSQKEIAKMILVSKFNIDEEEDSITYHSNKKNKYREKSWDFYFFKVKIEEYSNFSRQKDWMLYAIGFEYDSDGKVKWDDLITKGYMNFLDEADLKKVIDRTIDKEMIKDRPRASFIFSQRDDYPVYY